MAFKTVLFNHKGGVSKTTTSYNLGWMLASKGHRVLLVDADPQCNLSGLLLGDEFESYYFDDVTKNQNIKDGVAPAFQGKPKPIEAVRCFSPERNRNLFLLAGHANLSEYDPALSLAQNSNNAISALENLPGAFNELINKTSELYHIDFVIIDLNPGLSAINQNLFLLSDSFIVPTNPDPFSMMALNTLSSILPRWVDWMIQMRPVFEDATYPLSNATPKFIGEVIQRFNIRNGKAAKPYRDIMQGIKDLVEQKLVPAFKQKNMMFDQEYYTSIELENDFCLMELKDFQGLLPKANDAGVPVFELHDDEIKESGSVEDGLIRNRELIKVAFDELANKIIKAKEYADSH